MRKSLTPITGQRWSSLCPRGIDKYEYPRTVCGACAIAAVAGASGAKTWLQTSGASWLTPKRRKFITAMIVVALLAFSSIKLSGSSTSSGTTPTANASTTSVAVAASPRH